MNDYNVPMEIKCTFILNLILFIVGMALDIDIAVATGAIIFCILSVGINILEAIHKLELKQEAQRYKSR